MCERDKKECMVSEKFYQVQYFLTVYYLGCSLIWPLSADRHLKHSPPPPPPPPSNGQTKLTSFAPLGKIWLKYTGRHV